MYAQCICTLWNFACMTIGYVYMMMCIYEEGNHVNRMIGVRLNTKRDCVNLLSL